VGADGRFRGFDGVRAVAILLVIIWHGALVGRFPEEAMGPLRPLVMTGWAGVDLFFALSGFLITALILREEQRTERVEGVPRFSLRRFYLRRALRILPVFVVVFLVNTFVLSGHLPSVQGRRVLDSGSPLGLWPYATFWGNYFIQQNHLWGRALVDPGVAYTVFWSLCVEEHFYLLWPLFLTLVKGWRHRVLSASGVCLLMLVARYFAATDPWQHHLSIYSLSHYRMDSILWGALGALVVDRLPAVARPRRLALALVFALIAWLVSSRELSMVLAPTALGLSLGLTLLAVAATGLLIDLVKAPDSRLARVLEWPPLRVVGQLSYAMYLVHFPAIDLGRMLLSAKPRAPTLANLLLAWVLFAFLTVAAAAMLHVLVERPFLRFKERLSARRPATGPGLAGATRGGPRPL
jgi:peptidoglycan/LPS O-acetylase OafA/YrhL